MRLLCLYCSAVQPVYDRVLKVRIKGSAHGEPSAILQQHPGVGGPLYPRQIDQIALVTAAKGSGGQQPLRLRQRDGKCLLAVSQTDHCAVIPALQITDLPGREGNGFSAPLEQDGLCSLFLQRPAQGLRQPLPAHRLEQVVEGLGVISGQGVLRVAGDERR